MPRQYYLVLKGKSFGPLRPEHFVALAREGLVTHRSLVREHNTGEAVPIGRHPVIARTVFGSRAPIVKARSIMEDWRHRPVVGIAAGIAIVILASVN